MANFVRNVLIDGVKYAVGDKRIEGDNFAYIQVPEAITVGTNLTDLAPIQKALDSTDGAMLYVPSLNALFSPTASTSPTVRIWSSTVGDKGYQLKATLNASGVLQSAVVNEASAEAGLIITDAEWTPVLQQYLGKDPADFDSTGTYLITNEAKAIADKLVSIDMAAMIISAPDKFQIEIKNMYESMVNCVSSGLSMDDNIAGYIFNFKTLGNITYLDSSGQPTSISLDTIGAVFTGGLAGLTIKEPQPSEGSYVINFMDLFAKTMSDNYYTYKTDADALAVAQDILDHRNEQMYLSFDMPAMGMPMGMKPLEISWMPPNTVGKPTDLEFEGYMGRNTKIQFTVNASGEPVATGILTGTRTITEEDYIDLYLASKALTSDKRYVDTDMAKGNGSILMDFEHEYVRMYAFSTNSEDAGDGYYQFVKRYTSGTGTDFREVVVFSLTGMKGKIFGTKDSTPIPVTDIEVYYTLDADGNHVVQGIKMVEPETDDCVKVAKKYMEVEVEPVPIQFAQKEVTVDDDTLNINSKLTTIEIPEKEIIHYPTSVIFKGDDKFNLEFKIGWPGSSWTSGWYGVDEHWYSSTTYLEYSYDGATWIDIPKGVAMTPIPSKENNALGGHVIFIRGNSAMYARDMDICKAFITTDGATYVDLLGDIMGICPNPGYNGLQYFFSENNLIRDCSHLKMHSSFTESQAYDHMFYKCAGLTKIPTLHANKLAIACYGSMFEECTALTTVSVLPAAELATNCYINMFKKCSALTKAPDLLTEEVPQGAYASMFEECTSLVNPPIIKATSMGDSACLSMFQGCTLLKKCPDLPATSLSEACYLHMFDGCTALTVPVQLPATEIPVNAYNYMFDGCTGIKWATTGKPYRIPCTGEGTAVGSIYAQFMFSNNSGTVPSTVAEVGTPELNKTYYLESGGGTNKKFTVIWTDYAKEHFEESMEPHRWGVLLEGTQISAAAPWYNVDWFNAIEEDYIIEGDVISADGTINLHATAEYKPDWSSSTEKQFYDSTTKVEYNFQYYPSSGNIYLCVYKY